MTRHVPHTRHPSKPLKLRIQFTVNLTSEERHLLAEFAAARGYTVHGTDERTVLRLLLEDRGLNAIEQAMDEVSYQASQHDDTFPDADGAGEVQS